VRIASTTAGVASSAQRSIPGTRDAIARARIPVVIEILMIVAWAVLRTTVDVRSGPYIAWVLAACALALLSPTIGLVLVMSTAPFYEPPFWFKELDMRHVVVASLGIAVGVRLITGGWRQMPRSPTLVLGVAVGAITAISLIQTIGSFDQAFAVHASYVWLKSIGGAMILLVVGAWVARSGESRPLIAATVACCVAAVLSLAELVQPGSISDGPLGWIGFWKDFGVRVSGIIPAPNAVGTMLMIPAVAAIGAALALWGWRRVAATLAAVILAITAALTWSRSAIGALFIAGVVFMSRRSGRLAAIALALGLVGAIVLLPAFIQLRADRAGSDVIASPIEFIIGADGARVTAWKAATKMFLASPLVGHGFLSYKELADSFGDPRLGSPHNEVLRLFAEEGIVGGLAILGLAGSMLLELARRPGWIGASLLAGSIGYWLAAMFNNPLLYIQVSAMAFGFASYGIAAPLRHPSRAEPGPEQVQDPRRASTT